MQELLAVVKWSKDHNIDLDRATIRMRDYMYSEDRDAIKSLFGEEHDIGIHAVKITFQHSSENAANFREVKRAVGGALHAVGGRGSTLESAFFRIGDRFAKIAWEGAYECQIKVKKEEEYECTPVDFPGSHGVTVES